MWIIFGLVAIAATFLNLYMYVTRKDYKLAMAMGLSFTALTVCASYSDLNGWIKVEDWTALIDVVPALSKVLWFLTLCAIFLI